MDNVAAVEAAVAAASVSPASVRHQLRIAISELRLRGLSRAALWASEQLTGLAEDGGTLGLGASDPESGALGNKNMQSDLFLFARCVFDAGEFERCAELLERRGGGGASGGGALNPLEKFLRWYAKFLAGEKRKECDALEGKADGENRRVAVNPHLEGLLEELQSHFQVDGLDAFGLWLLGVVLKELLAASSGGLGGVAAIDAAPSGDLSSSVIGGGGGGGPAQQPLAQRAIGALVASILQFPYNWSAWLDLAALCIDADVLPERLATSLPAECRWMHSLFLCHVLLEQQQPQSALEVLEPLAALLPASSFLASCQALAHNATRSFDLAEERFAFLREQDPLRLEHLDVLSNILFVRGARKELSHLAHRAAKVDKFRAETCVAIGNYYGLKGQHERAVLFFRRALRCDRKCLSAHTLMGHEYIELKNTPAAIEAYRNAVDVNPRDFRAWYGLGQTYEILQMFAYALHYYGKAAALRPYDARMWCALGGCYQRLKRDADAIRCYERALANDDLEGIATVRLARLYAEDGQSDKAASNYRRHVEMRLMAVRPEAAMAAEQGGEAPAGIYASVGEPPSQETVEALLFLAGWHRERREWLDAVACCHRVLEYPGQQAQDEAKAILRQIRSQQERRGAARERKAFKDDMDDWPDSPDL